MSRIAAGQQENLVIGLGEPLIAPLVPQPLRDDVMLLWALDRRLAELARTGKEPTLRQIRLRWWSEQLAGLRGDVVPGEPLLAMVAERLLGRIGARELAALTDAWEAEAVGEDDGSGKRGVLLFGLTARLLGQGDADVAAAGRLWATLERGVVEGHLPEDVSTSLDMSGFGTPGSGLPRALAAVTALAKSIARRGGVRSRWREQLVVFRAGLLGR